MIRPLRVARMRLGELALDNGFHLSGGVHCDASFHAPGGSREPRMLALQVPPMPAAEALAVLQAELLGQPLDEIFAWINLDTPLGSASIAQVGLLAAVGKAPAWMHLYGVCLKHYRGCQYAHTTSELQGF